MKRCVISTTANMVWEMHDFQSVKMNTIYEVYTFVFNFQTTSKYTCSCAPVAVCVSWGSRFVSLLTLECLFYSIFETMSVNRT